ncbi:ABC transporter permease subunit [Rhodococcus aetherivorans]
MDLLVFGIFGLAAGSGIALVSLGLVLTYRASGILNFAQAAFVMVGAYVYYALRVEAELPGWVAVVGAVIACGLGGLAIFWAVIGPLRHSGALIRVIGTLAIVAVLQSLVTIIYGVQARTVPGWLPTGSFQLASGASVGQDRLWIFGIAVVLTAVLGYVYRRTAFGRVTSAVAENVRSTAMLGHSPDVIASLNWALSAALAGLAGTLIAPIGVLTPSSLLILIIPALAAALLGQFTSFGVTLGAALGIGLLQSWITNYSNNTSLQSAVPFAVIILVLVVRGRGLPMRDHIYDSLPHVGTGRIRWIPLLTGTLVGAVLIIWVIPTTSVAAVAATLGLATICLSVVVITGYAGQLSLAQYVLAGLAGFMAAKLTAHLPFLLAVITAIVLAAVVGVLIGLPALRTRGAVLGVVTLGMGQVIYELVLNNTDVNGGILGVSVQSPEILGWSIDPLLYPERYATACLLILVLLFIAVANLRRGAVGRRLLAVRSNEVAAASVGVSIVESKLYAFAVSAVIAAAGGVMFAFLQTSVIAGQFTPLGSINIVVVTVVGGIGMVGGSVLGATLLPGTIIDQLLNISALNLYLPLAGGLLLLIVLRTNTSGLFEMNRLQLAWLATLVRSRMRKSAPTRRTTPRIKHNNESDECPPITPRALHVTDLEVDFSGIVAVNHVDLTVMPGQIHGLIGPNGAGKTTLIDGVSGLVKCTSGRVILGDVDVTRWSPVQRARAGMSRSFQSLELFDDLTVMENLAVAADTFRRRRYLVDLVRPEHIELPDLAHRVIDECDLADVLDSYPTELSYGRRRLVGIARAMVWGPSVLLLDEPAAGLDDAESAELARVVRALANDWGVAVLVVEHRMDLVRSVCDEVTVLASGSVIARGAPEEVLDDSCVLESYLGVNHQNEKEMRTTS